LSNWWKLLIQGSNGSRNISKIILGCLAANTVNFSIGEPGRGMTNKTSCCAVLWTGYLEIIEIKTPIPELFKHDLSRDSYYPSEALSRAIGQVTGYIEQLDSDRNRIRAIDHEDQLKIRARIILGRDGDKDQRTGLRNLNAHLNRIEVLTYDQLLRIAGRVLNVFAEQHKAICNDIDDLPF
jgi:hypothetical protein